MKSVPKPRGTRRVQYAALPYRQRQDGEIQIRLITSRETRRWVIPKGWPMKGLSPSKAAAREAYEEAGLLGSISSEPLGLYSYDKRLTLQTVPCDVMVFPLKVKRYVKKWPERSERFGFWFSVESAAAAVQEADLRLIILAFGEQMAARFAEKRSRSPEAEPAARAPDEVSASAVDISAKAAAKSQVKPKSETKSEAKTKAAAKPKVEAKPKGAAKAKADAKPKALAKPKAAAKPKQKQVGEIDAEAASEKPAKGKLKPPAKAKGQRVVLAEKPAADWAEDEASARLPVLPGVSVPSTRH